MVKHVFRPGTDVLKSSSAVEALVEMWDENVFTVTVEKKLSPRIKEGDVVLIDYSPTSGTNPAPRQLVTVILRGKAAEACMAEYKGYYEKQKRGGAPQTTPTGFR